MRLTNLWEELDDESRVVVAQSWGVTGANGDAPTLEQLLNALRGRAVVDGLQAACASAVMREDLALLCANPFDRIAADELVDADAFSALALVSTEDGRDFEVTLDIALAALPYLPVEFGFVATMLSRLDAEELNLVGKAVEVGPRATRVIQALDIAARLTDEAWLMRLVAFLRESDRRKILDAIALGDLPDDVSKLDPSAPAPMVTLDDSEVGARGLLFWFEDPHRDIDARPVVPLELMQALPELFEKVPPPPEVVAAKSKKRRGPRAAPKKKAPATPAWLEAGEEEVPKEAPIEEVPRYGLSLASAFDASAVVDLETARAAQAAQKDAELGDGVLAIVSDSLVVLHADIDAADWAERAALRLGL